MIKGIVRSLDQLGRLCIPKEIRRDLNIKNGEPLDIYLRDGVICIEKCKLQCVICGNDEEEKLVEVQGVHICKECAEKAVSAVEK